MSVKTVSGLLVFHEISLHFTDKQYVDDEEERARRLVFESNVDFIDEHNKKYIEGEESYFLSVNQFADMVNTRYNTLTEIRIMVH